MGTSNQGRIVKRAMLLLFAALLAILSLASTANAQEQKTIVRVGWYESPFNITDELGRRSGYAYDYQQKIAAHTGWTYEYVEGSWSDLLQMLEEGKIDLLGDVSHTDERAKNMLYSSLPMGSEEYYLYANPNNEAISPEDLSTFNGKKIGANKGSIQIDYYRKWADANGVKAELVELAGTEEDNLKELSCGNIDLYLSVDGFFDKGSAMPICKVGVSDFYFAVSKSRPELLPELNNAMNRIVEEDQYYNQSLYSKYLHKSSTSSYLNTTEREWVDDHKTIKVGYQDNYLAFCAKDPNTGELTGALKEYLSVASDCLENAHLDFEPICYPTSAAALDALSRGEVDCVFPVNLTDYDGEVNGVFVTPTLMRTNMLAVVREADQRGFAERERVTVAVNAGNLNYDTFLLDHFPNWHAIHYEDTAECLKAVAEGQADCVLISSYRYNDIANICDQHKLTTYSTGVEIEYCFAVRRDDTTLYSILAKTTDVVPPSTINAALTHYFAQNDEASANVSPGNTLLILVICVLVAAAVFVLFMLVRDLWKKERASSQKSILPTKEDFILFDDLPLSYSVYRVSHAEHSKLYDAEVIYANHKFEQIGGRPVDTAIGRSVRELFPYIEEQWFVNAKGAAIDGETAEYDYTDPLSGKTFHTTVRQVACPGYCSIVYQEKL